MGKYFRICDKDFNTVLDNVLFYEFETKTAIYNYIAYKNLVSGYVEIVGSIKKGLIEIIKDNKVIYTMIERY